MRDLDQLTDWLILQSAALLVDRAPCQVSIHSKVRTQTLPVRRQNAFFESWRSTEKNQSLRLHFASLVFIARVITFLFVVKYDCLIPNFFDAKKISQNSCVKVTLCDPLTAVSKNNVQDISCSKAIWTKSLLSFWWQIGWNP